MSDQPSYHENALLFLIADGDEGAMRALFEQYYPRLYYFGYKLTKDGTEAQDQAQEALTALWQHRDKFRQATLKEAEAFLFTVVRNRSYKCPKHGLHDQVGPLGRRNKLSKWVLRVPD